MANIVNQPHVLVLDTAADNIVAATIGVRIRKVRLSQGTAAAKATLCEAGGTVEKIALACLADESDTVEFYAAPLSLAGLKLLSIAGASAKVYVYTESA